MSQSCFYFEVLTKISLNLKPRSKFPGPCQDLRKIKKGSECQPVVVKNSETHSPSGCVEPGKENPVQKLAKRAEVETIGARHKTFPPLSTHPINPNTLVAAAKGGSYSFHPESGLIAVKQDQE